MSIKTEKAAQNHQKGYNCAQAVACAFSEEMEIDETIIFKMMEGHGLGMGCMEGTCGAVTAACVIAGAKNSDRCPEKLWKHRETSFQSSNLQTLRRTCKTLSREE